MLYCILITFIIESQHLYSDRNNFTYKEIKESTSDATRNEETKKSFCKTLSDLHLVH